MSEEYLRGQISAKEDEITRIEEEAAKKEASAEAEIEQDYDPKIDETKLKLEEEENLRDEAIEKAAEWTEKKKEKIATAKEVTKELATLKKEKEKALRTSVDLTWEANNELTDDRFIQAEGDYRRAISKSRENTVAPYNLGTNDPLQMEIININERVVLSGIVLLFFYQDLSIFKPRQKYRIVKYGI